MQKIQWCEKHETDCVLKFCELHICFFCYWYYRRCPVCYGVKVAKKLNQENENKNYKSN